MQNSSFCFWFFFLFAATFCHGSDLTTVEVVGVGECADCHENNIKSTHAFSGLRVSIDCKQKDGDFERKGVAVLDEEGKFKVLLPTEVLTDGKLKKKCFAQLHSASSTPCPSHDSLESSMIVFKSKGEGKQTFGLSGGLKFKSATCVSAFFWHHHPPLPPISFPVFPPHPPLFGHPYVIPPFHHKFFPPKAYPPPPTPKELIPPPVYEPPPVPEKPPPVYEKPPPVYEKPPPVYVKPPPVYEKPPPVYEKPPPVYVKPPPVYEKPPPIYEKPPPVYKKPPPVYEKPPPVYKKPVPPPVPPVYKKPLPPPVYKPKPPVYKPEPPVYQPKPPKPPVYEPKPPAYKPPAPEKALPPPAPPVYKHPWYKILPPISKLPPCPPVPKVIIPAVPPKYFSHPKFPPLPPSVPHP